MGGNIINIYTFLSILNYLFVDSQKGSILSIQFYYIIKQKHLDQLEYSYDIVDSHVLGLVGNNFE